MPHSTFGERFGFAVFLAHMELGEPPAWAEIGRAVGRTGPAVSAWARREEPPPDEREDGERLHVKLLRYFEEKGVGLTASWLIDDEGDAPLPDLWFLWLARRRRKKKERRERGVA